MEASRSLVLSLAVSRSDAARTIAADTLDCLGDAVADLSATADSTQAITEVRLEAEKLRGATPMVFGQAAWVRAGLTAALDGITADLPRKEAARLEPWARTARLALDNIDEHGGITFQRAQVQDAFRTVVDVFAVRAGVPVRRPGAPASQGPNAARSGAGHERSPPDKRGRPGGRLAQSGHGTLRAH